MKTITLTLIAAVTLVSVVATDPLSTKANDITAFASKPTEMSAASMGRRSSSRLALDSLGVARAKDRVDHGADSGASDDSRRILQGRGSTRLIGTGCSRRWVPVKRWTMKVSVSLHLANTFIT